MSELFFVIKSLIFTFMIIMLLQIKIGRLTLEQRSMDWLHQSNAIEALQGVADGGVKLATEGFAWGKKVVGKKIPEMKFEENKSKAKSETRKHWQNEVDETEKAKNVDLD